MSRIEPVEFDRRSTAELLAHSLRSRLLAGEFPPGTPMRDSSLAPQFGVSRATMREALQHLAHEGIVTYQMHRGMVVTDLTPDDVTDIHTTRLVIEVAAITAAAEHPVDTGELEYAIAHHRAAIEGDDIAAVVDADMGFHQALVALSPSSRLAGTHRAAIGQLRLALNNLDRAMGDPVVQLREHRRILRLIKKGEFDSAAGVLRGHIERAGSNLVEFLRQPG